MMRYHSVYDDMNGNDLQWVTKVSEELRTNRWDGDTPLLFDGHHWVDDGDNIRYKAALRIFQALSYNTTVQAIHVRNWHMNHHNDHDHDTIFTAFANAFHEHSIYRSISIRNMTTTAIVAMDYHDDDRTTTTNMFPVPSTIFRPKLLREVTLESCYLNRTTCMSLASMLESKKCSLRSLDIRSVKLDDIGLQHISTAIAHNTSLRYVTIRDLHHYRDDTICQLLLSFATNHRIQLLELEQILHHRDNGKTNYANCIATMLKHNTSIEILSLRRNHLCDSDIQIIMQEGVPYNHMLQTLYLSENDIQGTNGGATAIVYGLTHNVTLTELCLRRCRISYEGCRIIAKGLAQFRHLRYLNMSQNNYHFELCSYDILHCLQYNHIIHCVLPDNPSRSLRRQQHHQQEEEDEAKRWDDIEILLRYNRANRKAVRDLYIQPKLLPQFLSKNYKIMMQQNPDILYHFIQNMVPLLYHNNDTHEGDEE